MRILAFLTDPEPVRAIPRHLELPVTPRRPSRPPEARPSPTSDSTSSTLSTSTRRPPSIPLSPSPSRTSTLMRAAAPERELRRTAAAPAPQPAFQP